MGTFLNQAKTQQRSGSSTRVKVAIPITISTKDKSGRAFKEDCRTIVISDLGVLLLTTHDLPINAEITVTNQENGRTAQGYIVWAAEERSSSQAKEVGAYLSDGEFLWDIALPAENSTE